ncbi:MAG TPA: outer membrane beta-barrel protein [Aquabacterium sp.]|nr:outer membrane beta-barrel protein [Aquabacterium sp.]
MKKIVLGLMSVLAAGAVGAQTFIGASLTTNKVNIDCAGTVSCTSHGAGGKVFGGYVSPKSNIGGEVSYLLLGTGKSATSAGSVRTDTDYEASGVAAAVVFRGVISRDFWVHAKVGVARVELKADSRDSLGVSSGSTQSTTQPYFGLGLEYGLVDSVKGVAYIDSTKGKIDGHSTSLSAIGLGLEFIF